MKRICKRWTPEEIELLEKLVPRYDRSTLYERFQEEAARRGWYPRTRHAIWDKLERLGMHSEDGPHYPLNAIATILGIHVNRVQYWKVKGLLNAQTKAKTTTPCYVHLFEIRRFLLAHPEELAGATRDGLLYFLGNPKTVDSLIPKIPKTYKSKRQHKVIRNSIGQTFASQSEAARHSCYSLSGFRRLLADGGIDAHGVRWWRVD